MKTKLKIKDYITIGIFVAIYFFCFNLIAGIIASLSPKMIFICQGFASLILAPVYMLFVAKVQRKWAILIFGVIMTSIMMIMTGGAWPMVFGYLGVGIAEFIARSGEFKSAIKNNISYIFFAYWSVGLGFIYYLMGDQVEEILKSSNYDSNQIIDFMSNINMQTFAIGIPSIAVLAFIGGLLGRKMLKKHFEKSGIV